MTPEQIAEAAKAAADEAVPELEAIAEAAIKDHNLPAIKLTPDEMCRIGLALNDIQQNSFNLGAKVGQKMLIKLLRAGVK